MKHFSTRFIILALFMTILMILPACGSNTGEDNVVQPEPPAPHAHEYIKGECSCGEIDGTYYSEGLVFRKCDDGYKITGYTGTALKLFIPDTYEGEPVTIIGEYSLSSKISFATVNIGKNVHTIEKYAFMGAQRLVEIVIPEQVKNIGIGAFESCTKVKNIKFNAIKCNSPYVSIETDGLWNYVGTDIYECVLTIGKTVKEIPNGMFFVAQNVSGRRPNIRKVIFEDNSQCESIGYVAFYNLRDLELVDFGKNSSLKRIGETAFGNAQKVEEYILPDSIEVIEKYALSGSQVLKRISLPEGEWEAVKKSSGIVVDRVTVTTSTPEYNHTNIYSKYSGYTLTRKF